MSYSTGPIPTLRTMKALRGESFTIDLGKVFSGTLTCWMKKSPNADTYRSFNIVGNRYLQLPQNKASDFIDILGNVTEAVEGKWYFDVEQVLDPQVPEDVSTIYQGTIIFKNDITGSAGVEVLDPLVALDTFIGLTDTPNVYGTAKQIIQMNGAGTALVWVDKQFDDSETAAVKAHLTNTSNPHSVTKAQLGLADAENPIVEAFLATAGQTSHTVGAAAISDNGFYEIQVGGIIWNSRTGIIGFPLGNISIDFGTGEITFHFPLAVGTQVIIKHN